MSRNVDEATLLVLHLPHPSKQMDPAGSDVKGCKPPMNILPAPIHGEVAHQEPVVHGGEEEKYVCLLLAVAVVCLLLEMVIVDVISNFLGCIIVGIGAGEVAASTL